MLAIRDVMRALGLRIPWHLGMPCDFDVLQILGNPAPERAAAKDWHLGMSG